MFLPVFLGRSYEAIDDENFTSTHTSVETFELMENSENNVVVHLNSDLLADDLYEQIEVEFHFASGDLDNLYNVQRFLDLKFWVAHRLEQL